MRKLALAVAVGVVLGAIAFSFARGRTPTPAVTLESEASAEPLMELAPAPTPLTEPGLIITVERDGRPVANARVALGREFHKRWVTLNEAVTNAAGVVELPASAGAYVAVARADDGSTAVQFFDVARATTPTRVTLLLKATATLTGSVVNAETKQPIGGALVQATLREGALPVGAARADSFGRFSVAVAPAERWFLTASAPEHLRGTSESDGGATTLELTRGVRLEGTVVDETGATMTGATVDLAPADVPSVETDEHGRFTATIARGPVSMHATTPSGLQALQRLIAKNDVERVTLVVRGGTPLRGSVRDARGPAAGVEVRVLAEPEDLLVAALQTNAEGLFEAAQLPAGRYSVEAIRGAGSQARAIGVELPREAPVLLELPDAARLTGLVDIDGEPAEGALVTIEWARGLHEPRRAARTGADGRYVFDDLPSAAIEVTASLGNLNAAKPDVYLPPASAMELNLSLTNLARFFGRVVSDGGTSRIGLKVRDAQRITPYPLTDGGFDLTVAVGTYDVFLEVDDTLVKNVTLELRGGEDNEAVLFADPPWKHPDFLHQQLGSGLSFDNVAGSVRVDFLMEDCPAAKAGVRLGDLVISIDGAPVRDSIDAFARVNKPLGAPLTLVVRRNGADVPLTLR